MKKILIDSGPLIALFDASDKYHSKTIDFIKNNDFELITSMASVAETMHILDFNRNAQLDFIQWIINGAVTIGDIGKGYFIRINQLIDKYRDLPMDFADACLVCLGENLEIDTVATIDRDFTIYRLKGRKKFKLAIS